VTVQYLSPFTYAILALLGFFVFLVGHFDSVSGGVGGKMAFGESNADRPKAKRDITCKRKGE
jgi:hypothetical protein